MKLAKTMFLAGVVAVLAVTIVGLAAVKRDAARRAAGPRTVKANREADLPRGRDQARRTAAPVSEPAAPERSSPEQIRTASAGAPRGQSANVGGETNARTQTVAGQAQPAPRPSGATVQDPLARAALSFVGADPDCEAYWVGAINDQSLSAQERQDLIEDLNEDGFPDPENPTANDLPLIVGRVLLIEQLAPDALDQVNADAFQEAHKDLVDMFTRVTQP